jgi:SAM-dependent methyltransferase
MLICPECGKSLREEPRLVCGNCGWLGEYLDGIPAYLSARDLADPVLKEYLKNYDQIAADDLVKSIQDERFLEYQALNLADLVGSLEGLRVCDVGCGKGFLARALLARRPAELTVVDVATEYLQRLRHIDGIRAVVANAENLPYRAAFDVIVATDIMEHVLNVGSFLYCLNRALRPGGKAYIRVPLQESLVGYSPFLGCPYRFVHLRSFDKGLLRTQLQAVGFDILGFYRDGFYLDIPRDIWRRGRIRAMILRAFVRLVARRLRDPMEITRWHHWAVGAFLRPVTISVTARKVREVESPGNAQAGSQTLGVDSQTKVS